VPSLRAAVALTGSVALLAGGCNRGAAQESLAVAEQSLEEARPELGAHAPEELAALRALLEGARADLEAGRYTDALRTAQDFPARLRAARNRAERRQRELRPPHDPRPGHDDALPEPE